MSYQGSVKCKSKTNFFSSVSFVHNSKNKLRQNSSPLFLLIISYFKINWNIAEYLKTKHRFVLVSIRSTQSKWVVKIQKSIFLVHINLRKITKSTMSEAWKWSFRSCLHLDSKFYDTSISPSIKLKLPCKQVNRHFKHAKNTVKTPVYSTCIFTYHFRCKVQNQIKLAAKDTLAASDNGGCLDEFHCTLNMTSRP